MADRYKFSYAPQYSDLVYVVVFLIGAGTIALWPYPLFLILEWILVGSGVYLFVNNKPRICFYEDFIELRQGFGKSIKKTFITYADVKQVQYRFATVRGSHVFKIYFLQSQMLRALQYSFDGRPGKTEVEFLISKAVPIQVIPESAKHKLGVSLTTNK